MAHTSKGTTRSKTTATAKPPKADTTVRKTTAVAKPPKADATVRKTRTVAKNNGVSPERRQAMIAEAAYLRAEQRGFGPGDPLEDWLAAEHQVDLLLAGNATTIAQ